MSYITRLRQALSTEIASGRLGTPVFARLSLAVSADHGHLLELAAQGVQLSSDVLGAQVEAILAAGSVEAGHLSVQVDFAGGKSALVSISAPGESAPWLDLFVLGTRGSLSHAPPDDLLSDELTDQDLPLFGERESIRVLSKTLATSLESGERLRVHSGKGD